MRPLGLLIYAALRPAYVVAFQWFESTRTVLTEVLVGKLVEELRHVGHHRALVGARHLMKDRDRAMRIHPSIFRGGEMR